MCIIHCDSQSQREYDVETGRFKNSSTSGPHRVCYFKSLCCSSNSYCCPTNCGTCSDFCYKSSLKIVYGVCHSILGLEILINIVAMIMGYSGGSNLMTDVCHYIWFSLIAVVIMNFLTITIDNIVEYGCSENGTRSGFVTWIFNLVVRIFSLYQLPVIFQANAEVDTVNGTADCADVEYYDFVFGSVIMNCIIIVLFVVGYISLCIAR